MSDRAALSPSIPLVPVRRRPRRAYAAGFAAATFAVLLAGCGGSSSTSAPTTSAAAPGGSTSGSATTTPAASGSTTPGTAASGSATTGPTTPSAASPTTTGVASPPATTPSTAAPTASGSFCGFAQSQVAKALSAGASFGTNPTDLKQVATKFDAFEGSLLAATPAAIKPAMSGLLGFDAKLFALLAKDGYDFTKISPSDIASLEQGEAQEAQDAKTVTAYIESSCGIHIPT